MTTTTMHFGPEWMRAKQQPARPAPSPPLTTTPSQPAVSSYSALVAPVSQPLPRNPDLARPFRYSKEELLRIYKEGGGRGGLGLEVERWEGIVRELGVEPVGLKEMGEVEKKIFAGPLNSEIRRRQSTDYLSLSTSTLADRPKLGHASTTTGSPMRDRMGNFSGRRRDSTDQTPLTIPRKQSLSSMQGPLLSPREAPLPSPRVRVGHSSAFDGVLDGAWSAKRRASESQPKPPTSQNLPNEAGIKEEEEELRLEPHSALGQNSLSASPPPDPSVIQGPNNPTDNVHNTTAPGHIGRSDSVQNGGLNSIGHVPQSHVTSGPPPGLVDLAGVDWSYLDPQGQVQGPFRADVMQKWYDEGYFGPDLLMKRTHMDSDWIPVRDLIQLAGTTQLFLAPLNPPTPRPDPFVAQPAPDQDPSKNQFGNAFEPVPRPLHGSPLGYLNEDTSRTDSPTSSFSAGRFGNNSPDISTLGRVQPEVNAGGYSNLVEPQRRPTVEESLNSQPSFSNYVPGQVGRSYPVPGGAALSQEHTSYNPMFGAGIPNQVLQGAIPNPLRGIQESGIPNGQTTTLHFGTNDIAAVGGFVGQPDQSRLMTRDAFNRSPFETRQDAQARQYMNGAGGPYPSHSFTNSPSLSYTPSQDARSTHSLSSVPDRRSPNSPQVHQIVQQHAYQGVPSHSVTQSPWGTQEVSTPRRPGPFDPNFPTSHNIIQTPIRAPQQPIYTSPQVPTAVPSQQSPWYAASTGIVSEGWANPPASLTAANLGQHNQQQELLQAQATTHDAPTSPKTAEPTFVLGSNLTQEPSQVPAPEPESAVTPVPAPKPETTAETARPAKIRRKPSTPHTGNQAPPTKAPAPAPTVPVVKPASPTPPSNEAKPAWGIDEEHKVAPSPPVMGLREIQAAEAKKAEARKQAERERAARLAVSVPAPSTEEVQSFTASWGLPTSQAGAGRTHTLPKDGPTTPATPASAPVWTNSHKPQVAKKTMKEIQEEEERRKKQATEKKETIAAAARRGYAETTNKPTPVVTGGAWTTVGASGKTSAATIAAARPAAPTTPTAAKIVASTSGPAHAAAPAPAVRTLSSGPLPTRAAAAVVASSSQAKPKVEEAPAPSHDFLKWLSESLRGLNSSVNFEEITSMLLSFPVDPDQSTVEIISELIYANSTTLDGRRFAAEFVSRRKASVKANPPTGTPGKPLSIADVVKSQPKPAQNEWNGFKVVNKKKKGTRS